jgi:hypothetical protein
MDCRALLMAASGSKPEAILSVRLSASACCGHWPARGSVQVKPLAQARAVALQGRWRASGR